MPQWGTLTGKAAFFTNQNMKNMTYYPILDLQVIKNSGTNEIRSLDKSILSHSLQGIHNRRLNFYKLVY
jgi:hypothetical protein